MDRHTIILTLDKRQEKLGNLLSGKKQMCSWENYEEKRTIGEKIYVLPIPVTKLDAKPEIKEKLKQELAQNTEDPRITSWVFGGLITEEWKNFLEKLRIPYWDFMKLPEVVDGNGWITAEATVAEVLQHGERSIWGQKVLVTGYGCCGTKIARLFSALGAKVIVAARRTEVRLQAQLDGYSTTDFSEIPDYINEMDSVINTVPSMVITEELISRMKKDALIVDIASNPGGTDFGAAKKWGISAKLALGLPGIYTTTSSAALLKNAISTYAPLQKDVRGDHKWIFQIII